MSPRPEALAIHGIIHGHNRILHDWKCTHKRPAEGLIEVHPVTDSRGRRTPSDVACRARSSHPSGFATGCCLSIRQVRARRPFHPARSGRPVTAAAGGAPTVGIRAHFPGLGIGRDRLRTPSGPGAARRRVERVRGLNPAREALPDGAVGMPHRRLATGRAARRGFRIRQPAAVVHGHASRVFLRRRIIAPSHLPADTAMSSTKCLVGCVVMC